MRIIKELNKSLYIVKANGVEPIALKNVLIGMGERYEPIWRHNTDGTKNRFYLLTSVGIGAITMLAGGNLYRDSILMKLGDLTTAGRVAVHLFQTMDGVMFTIPCVLDSRNVDLRKPHFEDKYGVMYTARAIG